MRHIFCLVFLCILSALTSSLLAQSLGHSGRWNVGAYYRGFNIVADENQRNLNDISDLSKAGATLVYIGTKGFRGVEAPYAVVDSNIAFLDHIISLCHAANIHYAVNVRQGPGRRDVYLESIGDPLSTIWTNSAEQIQYASMLREIVDHCKADSLFIGIAPMTEPDPLSKGYFYVDTATLGKLLRSNAIDLQSIMQRCVDSIRSSSGDVPVLIQGPAYAAPEFIPMTPKIHDPHVIYEFHSYRPHEYVYASDTSTLTYPGDYLSYIEFKIAHFEKTYIKDTVFKYIYDRHNETDAPLFMGEFGVQWAHTGGVEFLTDLTSSAIENGWHFAYWAFGSHLGYGWDYELMPSPYWAAVVASFEGNAAVQENEQSDFKISLSPNPASRYLKIDLQPASVLRNIEIYDALGKMVKSATLHSSTTILNVADIPAGEYLVVIRGTSKVLTSRLIIIK